MLAAMRWSEATIHVIDFEGHPGYGVIEYGVATVRGGGITAAATRVCGPTGRIRETDSRVHGLFGSDTAGQPLFAADYDRFVEWRRTGVLAAHNKAVEHGLLKHTWAYPPFVPDWWSPGGECADWGPWVDSLRVYQTLYPNLESHSLGALIDAFHLGPQLTAAAREHCPPRRRHAHCALFDALASALLLNRLLSVPEAARATLATLLRWSGGNPPPQPGLFGD